MNKIKSLILLVLCAVMIGGGTGLVSAQAGDQILVSAGGKTLKQSDVDKLIRFYEWAFQAEFDSKQRADFREHTAGEFRASPKESRGTIDDIVNTFPKIIAASDDMQAATRKNFLDAFLPEARKNTDANSRLLLQIYENANGAAASAEGQGAAASNDESSAATTGGSGNDSYETVKKVKVGDFSAIVGKWVTGNTGSITKTTSGAYLGGNASRHTYQFGAGGAVEYTGIMNMMAGGCRTQIFKTAKGKATLNGGTLTIDWSPAAFSYENSCGASKNYKKTLPAESETFQINFETFYDDKQLCLNTGKDKTCMSRD